MFEVMGTEWIENVYYSTFMYLYVAIKSKHSEFVILWMFYRSFSDRRKYNFINSKELFPCTATDRKNSINK